MKKKIFWMFILICSASLFSAAKQSGQNCSKPVGFKQSTVLECKKTGSRVKADHSMGLDLSPLHFFLGAL